MNISKKAKEGLKWGTRTVERCLNEGKTPKQALEYVGIEDWTEIFWFFEWLDQTGRKDLIERLSR